MTRQTPPPCAQADVLVQSRRRCCVCFGLHRDLDVKRGQIAHLDHDSSNGALDNLAFLCFDHHDQYDSKTSQAKNLTRAEVKAYRDELHAGIVPILEGRPAQQPPSCPPGVDKFRAQQLEEQRELLIERLGAVGVGRSLSDLSRWLSVSTSEVQRRLFELGEEGVVRIDRQKGGRRKAYSLMSSVENRLLDTFVATLGEDPTVDTRHLRGPRDVEVDAYIETISGASFIVEILLAPERLSRRTVEQRVRGISAARRALGADSATGVLLVGISASTDRGNVDLKRLENSGVRVQFVELA